MALPDFSAKPNNDIAKLPSAIFKRFADARGYRMAKVQFSPQRFKDSFNLFEASRAGGTDAANRNPQADGDGLITVAAGAQEQRSQQLPAARLKLVERLLDEVLAFSHLDRAGRGGGVFNAALIQFDLRQRRFLHPKALAFQSLLSGGLPEACRPVLTGAEYRCVRKGWCIRMRDLIHRSGTNFGTYFAPTGIDLPYW